jgi:hypothetical protein
VSDRWAELSLPMARGQEDRGQVLSNKSTDTLWAFAQLTRCGTCAKKRAAYGTVRVVPSPVAVMENVPVLLGVYV